MASTTCMIAHFRTPTGDLGYYIGHYKLVPLPHTGDDPISNAKVSIIDTRTGEGGSFSASAITATLEAAMDTFFTENF